jgi:hypothetical protein
MRVPDTPIRYETPTRGGNARRDRLRACKSVNQLPVSNVELQSAQFPHVSRVRSLGVGNWALELTRSCACSQYLPGTGFSGPLKRSLPGLPGRGGSSMGVSATVVSGRWSSRWRMSVSRPRR